MALQPDSRLLPPPAILYIAKTDSKYRYKTEMSNGCKFETKEKHSAGIESLFLDTLGVATLVRMQTF